MRLASIGSGSRGNGTLVAVDQTCVLVDCGFSLRETSRRLARLGVAPEQLDAILVTHEHGDHVRGVGYLARRFQLPVYATAGTASGAGLAALGVDLRLLEPGFGFELGGVFVEPVAVPHDARQPTQFTFASDGRKVGVLTDLGSISSDVLAQFADCDALVLECNHDAATLARGPYPPSLKRRVAGPLGHLSNAQAASLLRSVDRERLKHLVLAHLSEKNNSPAHALEAVAGVFSRMDAVTVAAQDGGFDWLAVTS